MEAQPVEVQPKKSNRTVIIVVIVLIVLCCCCALAIGGYYGLKAYQAAQQAVDDFAPEMPDFNQPDFSVPDFETPEVPGIPELDIPGMDAGDPPQGGLTDDTLRNDTWQVVNITAIALGCDTPDAATSYIEVTQDPDSIGFWTERWTIACASGSKQAFDIEFIPTDGGGTTFNITPVFE